MAYAEQDKFFAQAYRTGTDHWTAIPFTRRAHELSLFLPKGALVLDIGTGRGRLLFDLADLGYRVIGLENNDNLIARGNNEIKEKELDQSLRFFKGTALDIPLVDHSFDAVVDVGLLQHILPGDYKTYAAEISRVLKPGGFFFLVALSKDTPNYFSWHPNKTEAADFEKEGVQYHFFSDPELRAMFEKDFEIPKIDHDLPYGPMDANFAVLLMRKK